MSRRSRTRRSVAAASAAPGKPALDSVDALCAAVRTAYPDGPEAVVAVVRAAFTALQGELAALRADVGELRRRLATDSTTSSKPPSTDLSRFHRRTHGLRVPNGRRAGGQPGHVGRALAWHPHPDRVVCHVPPSCGGCGRAFDGPGEAPSSLAHGTDRAEGRGRQRDTGSVRDLQVVERAQVVDLPPVTLTVTEHERLALTCAHCGAVSVAEFPRGLSAGLQYGPGVRAFAVALHSYHLVPYARTAECLDALLGTGPSAGSIARWVADAATALVPVQAAAGRAIAGAYAAHADETCLHVAGRRRWLHVAATATHTHYHIHPQRGLVGIDAGGVWVDFHGVMVHDGWWPYGRYKGAQHQLCLLHLQREARGLAELATTLGRPERWLTDIDQLLGRLHRLVRRAAAAGRAALDRRTTRALSRRYDTILHTARRRHPYPQQGRDNLRPGRPKRGPVAAFADRLLKYRAEVLRCAHDARVPPDNNQAERDLRMAKLADKISGGFRTLAGAQQFCVLRSALATGRKHGHTALTILRDVFTPAPSVVLTTPC